MIGIKRVSGIAGIFLDEHKTVAAAHKFREMGFKQFDAITPYPVHGIEEAVGIKRSNIPYVTFVAGILGCAFATWLMWWTSEVNWPINVGGKPFFSLPAFIPIMFELTVLFGALASVSALLYFCKLPQIDPPVIDPDLSSHKFAIFIPSTEMNYDEAKLSSLLSQFGAAEVKKVAEY
jgi:hypothetical protein